MIFLPASGRIAKPWKNGGGVTREVAAFPPDRGLETFAWRVSIADVSEDGPFSIFPSIDRTLTILSGEGIALDVDGAKSELHPGQPYSFPGDLPTTSVLLGGPVVDLNVMSRRGEISHQVTPIKMSQTIGVDQGILVWIEGSGRVTGPQGSFEMGSLDALQAVSPGDWTIEGETFLAYYARFTGIR